MRSRPLPTATTQKGGSRLLLQSSLGHAAGPGPMQGQKGLLLFPDLLGQVPLVADFFDLMKLCLNPVQVSLFVLEDSLE